MSGNKIETPSAAILSIRGDGSPRALLPQGLLGTEREGTAGTNFGRWFTSNDRLFSSRC